jgi:hypothetical protein
MRWLQGRGTGVIALANSTYAPMTELTARILDLVVDQGFGAKREPVVAGELQALGRRLVALLNSIGDWDASAAHDVFADNVVLDKNLERRRRDVAELIGEGGPLSITRWAYVNDADTTVELTDAAGDHLDLTFSVAPIRPLRVQEYDLSRRP